jgi:hypothetical protein
MEIRFVHEHDTLNKSRYSEINPGHVLRSLYLDTLALRQEFGGVPRFLVITVEKP